MKWSIIATVYVKELRDSLRDRRTLISVIIVPTVIMPLLVFGVGQIASVVVNRARGEVPRIMVLGGADSPGVVGRLGESGKFVLVPPTPDWRQRISDKNIRAAVEIPPGFEAGLRGAGGGLVVIHDYEGELKSGLAVQQLDLFFAQLRERTLADRLAERGLPADFMRPFRTRHENAAPPEKVGGNILGGIVPYMIILLCFTGAMYPAMDLTAGEKERGTMETLLCSPVARIDLVLGKFLLVLTGSVGAMACSLVSFGVTFGLLAAVGKASGIKGPARGGFANLRVDPAGLIGVVAMVLPVAVLFSAVIFTVSLFAKSYKEAQSYVAPMIFLVILPTAIGLLPGIELDARLALVPILNLSLVCREMLSGVWHWGSIVLIFSSTWAYAALALTAAVRMFAREDVIFRT